MMCGRRYATELKYIRVLIYYDKTKRHVFFWSHMAQLHVSFQFKCSSMKLLDDMKTKTKSAVESSYEFDSSQAPQSIGRNASRAQALLAETAFIYLVYLIILHL